MPQFSIKPFDELTNVDIYHILRARSQVFVVEQHCAYQDMDEVDFDCLHLVAHQHERLIGYCRIIPPNHNRLQPKTMVSDGGRAMASIGRVLVMPEYRNAGLAREILTRAINYCKKHYRKTPIIISAQTYLIGFYQSLGFVTDGDYYFEDGIEHVTMILTPHKKHQLAGTILSPSPAPMVHKLLYAMLLFIAAIMILGVLYLTI